MGNKQKFELLKQVAQQPAPAAVGTSTEDLKADVQTIKQLLLTRQASASMSSVGSPAATVVSDGKDKEEAAEDLTTSAPMRLASPSTGLKPWEQRRRQRIAEASPSNNNTNSSNNN